MNNQATIQASNIILNNYTTGNGKTNDESTGFKVSEKLTIEGLQVSLLGDKLTFINEAHMLAFNRALYYKTFKDMSRDQLLKLFTHLSSGEYLALNHTDKTQTDINKFEDYLDLFTLIDASTPIKEGNSQKYKLFYKNKEVNNKLLINSKLILWEYITDIIDDKVEVVGRIISLPKKD